MIIGHGDDLFRYSPSQIKVNFSSNIPNIHHPSLERHLAESIGLIASYPSPEPTALIELMAKRGIISNKDNTLITNGAVDAIYSLAQIYRGASSAVLAPTFSEYADAAKIYNHRLSFFSGPDELPCDVDLVWICNPNNPDGTIVDSTRLLEIVAAHRDKIFIIDQAYEDYVVATPISDKTVSIYPNLVILHSLTKRYQIPGLRIGYVAAHRSIIERLKQYRQPWSVNALAIEAAIYAVANPDEFDINASELVEQQKRLSNELEKIGIRVTPSATNFALCRLPDGLSASKLKEWLVDNHGLLIRDASNFYGLGVEHFRVAVQGDDNNKLLINAIKQWLQVNFHD